MLARRSHGPHPFERRLHGVEPSGINELERFRLEHGRNMAPELRVVDQVRGFGMHVVHQVVLTAPRRVGPKAIVAVPKAERGAANDVAMKALHQRSLDRDFHSPKSPCTRSRLAHQLVLHAVGVDGVPALRFCRTERRHSSPVAPQATDRELQMVGLCDRRLEFCTHTAQVPCKRRGSICPGQGMAHHPLVVLQLRDLAPHHAREPVCQNLWNDRRSHRYAGEVVGPAVEPVGGLSLDVQLAGLHAEGNRQHEIHRRVRHEDPRGRAGTPPTTAPAGTSCVTTALAPMVAPSPIVTPASTATPRPIHTSRPMWIARAACPRIAHRDAVRACMIGVAHAAVFANHRAFADGDPGHGDQVYAARKHRTTANFDRSRTMRLEVEPRIQQHAFAERHVARATYFATSEHDSRHRKDRHKISRKCGVRMEAPPGFTYASRRPEPPAQSRHQQAF